MSNTPRFGFSCSCARCRFELLLENGILVFYWFDEFFFEYVWNELLYRCSYPTPIQCMCKWMLYWLPPDNMGDLVNSWFLPIKTAYIYDGFLYDQSSATGWVYRSTVEDCMSNMLSMCIYLLSIRCPCAFVGAFFLKICSIFFLGGAVESSSQKINEM